MDTVFEISIGSDITEMPGILERLEEGMREYGFGSHDILDTQLAVEEAITNVIVHGYQRPGEMIEVSCRINRDRVEIQIADTAPRFDPFTVPEPDLESTIEDRTIGGLGIYLIRQVMDEVSYQYTNGRNCLLLIKRKKRLSTLNL